MQAATCRIRWKGSGTDWRLLNSDIRAPVSKVHISSQNWISNERKLGKWGPWKLRLQTQKKSQRTFFPESYIRLHNLNAQRLWKRLTVDSLDLSWECVWMRHDPAPQKREERTFFIPGVEFLGLLWIKPLDFFSLTLRHATCNNADYTNNTLWITHIICLVHDYIYHICCFCDRSIFTLSCETHWFIYFKQKNSQKRQKRVIHSIQRWQFYVDLLWQIVQFLEGKLCCLCLLAV